MEGGNYDTAPVLYTGKKSQSLNTFSSTAYTYKVRLILEGIFTCPNTVKYQN